LCDIGTDPFGDLLDRAVLGQQFNGRAIVVRRFAAIAGNPGCHILFAAGSEAQPSAATLAQVRDAPVLTVTDLPADSAVKGIINFVIRDNHVRFEIDQRQAAAHQIEISSKLLSLAVSTRP
jgi:regulator of protease activity HflC (stomatin/prohibitin superfamily)